MSKKKGLTWVHLLGESTCIARFAYDRNFKCLYVVFKGGKFGQVYRYEGVGRTRAKSLAEAKSKGKYFNSAFRGRVGKAL